jgi:hypothetical protein
MCRVLTIPDFEARLFLFATFLSLSFVQVPSTSLGYIHDGSIACHRFWSRPPLQLDLCRCVAFLQLLPQQRSLEFVLTLCFLYSHSPYARDAPQDNARRQAHDRHDAEASNDERVSNV